MITEPLEDINKKRILMINNYFKPFGGAEEVMYQEAKLLVQHGHHVSFFASKTEEYYDDSYRYKDDFVSYEKLKWNNIHSKVVSSLYNLESKSRLEKILIATTPDVVHIHFVNNIITTSILDTIKKYNIPVVMTIHGAYFVCPSGNLLKGGSQNCDQEHCVSGNPLYALKYDCCGSIALGAFRSIQYIMNSHQYLNKTDHLLAVSHAVKSLALKRGVDPEKLSVLHNFIPDINSCQEVTISEENYFLFVGRMIKDKGCEVIIKALQDVPDPKIIMIGDGPHLEGFKLLAEELNVINRMNFLGYIDNSLLESYYRKSLAVIVPSICFEAFPLTALESMHYKKPVIASNIGGLPELVDHLQTGLIFKPGSSKELSTALNKILMDPESAAEMGLKGYNSSHIKFSRALHYEKLINVYDMCIEEKQVQ